MRTLLRYLTAFLVLSGCAAPPEPSCVYRSYYRLGDSGQTGAADAERLVSERAAAVSGAYSAITFPSSSTPRPELLMRIHITGASGSGTTTLSKAVAAALGLVPLDADDYYWLPTQPPFSRKRPTEQRLALVLADVGKHEGCVLSGSIVGWGKELEDAFDLIVFLYLDSSVRVERLRRRELEQLGSVDPEFLEWAAQYDDGPPVGRSLLKHNAWLAARRCAILRIEGDLAVAERLARVCRCVFDIGGATAGAASSRSPPGRIDGNS